MFPVAASSVFCFFFSFFIFMFIFIIIFFSLAFYSVSFLFSKDPKHLGGISHQQPRHPSHSSQVPPSPTSITQQQQAPTPMYPVENCSANRIQTNTLPLVSHGNPPNSRGMGYSSYMCNEPPKLNHLNSSSVVSSANSLSGLSTNASMMQQPSQGQLQQPHSVAPQHMSQQQSPQSLIHYGQ